MMGMTTIPFSWIAKTSGAKSVMALFVVSGIMRLILSSARCLLNFSKLVAMPKEGDAVTTAAVGANGKEGFFKIAWAALLACMVLTGGRGEHVKACRAPAWVGGLKEVSDLINLDSNKCMIKIGSVAFNSIGYEIIEYANDIGFEIFLDLKLHDIPNTVKKSISGLTSLPIKMLTIHVK